MKPVSHPVPHDPLESAIGKLVLGKHKHEPEVSRSWHACFDVKKTEDEVVVFVDLPGVDEDEIAIECTDGLLDVSVSREFNHDLEDAEEYTHLERPYGLFACSVALPPGTDSNQMTAKYKRGVLKVRIPLKEA